MHPHRSSALGYASAASALHSWVYGACSAEAAASESSGLSVAGCIRARRYFGPHPVHVLSPHTPQTTQSTHHSRHTSRPLRPLPGHAHAALPPLSLCD